MTSIPHIQHARPQNAAREPNTPTQLLCIVRRSTAILTGRVDKLRRKNIFCFSHKNINSNDFYGSNWAL